MTNAISTQAARTPLLIGTNSRGDWVVRDRAGRRGGVFVSRASALRYVRLETGERGPRVTTFVGKLELETARAAGKPSATRTAGTPAGPGGDRTAGFGRLSKHSVPDDNPED